MIRGRFAYHVPESVEEAVAILSVAEDAACMAGGTWVVPELTSGVRRHRTVVDLRRAGLGGIRSEDGVFVVGATVTYAQLVASGHPLLATVARGITGGAQIRGQATLGGSACYAFPSSEAPAVLAALGARMRLASAGDTREVEATEFVRDAFVTVLRPGELLVEMALPPTPPAARFGYQKLKLSGSSWPIATAACVVTGGSARVALGGVAPRPAVLDVDLTLVEDDAAGLGELAASVIGEPWSDELAGGDYRRAVAPVVARRALAAALAT